MNKLTPEALCERAVSHIMKKEYADAAVILQDALMQVPDYADAWSNRGLCMLGLQHPFDAVLQFEKAIALRAKTNPEYYCNMGVAYYNMEMPDKAIECYNKALEINKDHPTFHMNLGNARKFKFDIPGAIAAYRAAIKCKADDANAHLMLSAALLTNGEYEEGWQEFEWRWKTDQLVRRGLAIPEWNGEPLEGKKLLIYSEQGHGDCLQFVRYAPLVKEMFGGKVALEVRNPMARLVKTVPLVDEVYSFGEKLPPDIDYAASMMSLPRICGTTVETIPWNGPYFSVDEDRVAMWRERISALPPGLRVGICWAGMSRPGRPEADAIDRRRSTTLSTFAPVALVPGVSWVSLQKGPPAEQVAVPPRGMTIGEWMDEADDFYDTAALIQCLDLVISVDTAVAHVAGGLGRPVWLLSRYDNCWRWLGHRKDSPWYPSLTQFSQPSAGDWGSVMNEVSAALRKFVQEHKQDVQPK